jgi:copper chaperone NosL
MRRLAFAAVLLLSSLGACKDKQAALPPAQELSADATAQFCGMLLSEHGGPKGQIFLRDNAKPLWFASVRDALAFTQMPEMPKPIVAIYVNDMGRAKNWDQPEAGTWIEARRAIYVIGSRRRSGMDTDEAVPFSDEEAARRFVTEYSGRIVSFADVPQSYIFPAIEGGS